MAVNSNTRPETWPISELEKALKQTPDAKRRLELPKFQRAIVWSTKKQQDLIQSLRGGLPVGSLLLYERSGTSSNIKTFLLVDGLQRTTAIKNYLHQPLAFLDLDELRSDALESLESMVKEVLEGRVSRSAISSAVTGWMRSTRGLDATDGFDTHTLVEAIFHELGEDDRTDLPKDIYKKAATLLDHIRECSDIRQISLPVIVYEGDEGQLPYIFEKINTAGTQLSRFDVFAASWVSQETEVANKEIRNAIEQKYEQAIEQGFQVSGWEDDPKDRSFSLWEYLFGLGKLLSREHPLLYGAETQDVTQLEPEGFTLATIAHGHRLSEMKSLPLFFSGKARKIDPTNFERAVSIASKEASAILAPFLSLRLNRRTELPSPVHTEYQIASIVGILLATRFDPPTFKERPAWKNQWKTLRKTLPQYYLYDVLRQVWRGSGDSRLFDWVWQGEEQGRVPSENYLRRLTLEEWEQALELWLADQLQKLHKSRAPIRGVDKLFLKFVYADKVSVYKDKAVEFEIEHLFPVGRLRELVVIEGKGLPISSVGNLALFPGGLNKGKGDKTISEYFEKIPKTKMESWKRQVTPLLFAKLDSIQIPRSNGRDALSRSDYEKFLKRRFERMKKELFRTLDVN